MTVNIPVCNKVGKKFPTLFHRESTPYFRRMGAQCIHDIAPVASSNCISLDFQAQGVTICLRGRWEILQIMGKTHRYRGFWMKAVRLWAKPAAGDDVHFSCIAAAGETKQDIKGGESHTEERHRCIAEDTLQCGRIPRVIDIGWSLVKFGHGRGGQRRKMS